MLVTRRSEAESTWYAAVYSHWRLLTRSCYVAIIQDTQAHSIDSESFARNQHFAQLDAVDVVKTGWGDLNSSFAARFMSAVQRQHYCPGINTRHIRLMRAGVRRTTCMWHLFLGRTGWLLVSIMTYSLTHSQGVTGCHSLTQGVTGCQCVTLSLVSKSRLCYKLLFWRRHLLSLWICFNERILKRVQTEIAPINLLGLFFSVGAKLGAIYSVV